MEFVIRVKRAPAFSPYYRYVVMMRYRGAMGCWPPTFIDSDRSLWEEYGDARNYKRTKS